jgi:large subunit ribosomal protein L7/L12
MTNEEIVEAVGALTVLELVDLVKELEDKFGVSALAPVVNVQNTTFSPPIDPEPEEQTAFDVYLMAIGDRKIQVIKAVRELVDLGLRESKAVVDSCPSEVLRGVPKEQAEGAKEHLERAGATAEVR